jgi:hypothetical protein
MEICLGYFNPDAKHKSIPASQLIKNEKLRTSGFGRFVLPPFTRPIHPFNRWQLFTAELYRIL